MFPLNAAGIIDKKKLQIFGGICNCENNFLQISIMPEDIFTILRALVGPYSLSFIYILWGGFLLAVTFYLPLNVYQH